ncbi:hypothetical protein [Planococcus lenghuensis]|uniref:Uncharacterized protein n=1 Tax=Planococcus lenghuensis TaxID=2213202 RepID=A0A1Q2L2E8_9BACL|nr:hypothetical protein [Planococcus lenghuensis]AQQ54576.1 hypothetical protein B0X71_16680 [Planococcus lenghuensis]
MGKFWNTCQAAGGAASMYTWVDEEIQLPADGGQRATNEGLTFQPLREIMWDTLTWESARTETERKAGLDPGKEQAVLKSWSRKMMPV